VPSERKAWMSWTPPRLEEKASHCAPAVRHPGVRVEELHTREPVPSRERAVVDSTALPRLEHGTRDPC